MPVNVVTHNVNGFDRNEGFVRDTCSMLSPCILGIQEHWLRPPSKRLPGVNKLMTIHPDLDGWGISAMKEKMQQKILHGRPFGGTGYVWSKNISNSIKTRREYIHERVTVLEISTNIGSILIINLYMPYYDRTNIESQTDVFIETISFVDSVISDNSGSKVILLGDMNCNIYDRENKFSVILNDFLSSRNLMCTFDIDDSALLSTAYTRCDPRRNSYTLLDYIFVSKELSSFVSQVTILDLPLNLSDHLPVKTVFSFDIASSNCKSKPIPCRVDWSRVTGDIRVNYENVMKECLDDISIPDILHGPHLCNDPSHLIDIERYYQGIIDCIKTADQQLPRCKPTTRKFYWNTELSSLKNDSIAAHDLWKLNGCPSSGPIYDTKKNAHYRYKLFLRRCKRDRDLNHIDELNSNLADGDHDKFWRSFKYFNYSRNRGNVFVNNLSNDEDVANCFADSFENIYESRDAQQSEKLHDEFVRTYRNYASSHDSDPLTPFYLTWYEMVEVLSKLKTGKATSTFLKAEHILLGSPKLAIHLHLLFNAMIQHSYVPKEFLEGVISPLVKDAEGDHSDPNNYRGLTLGVVISQLFEHALLLKIGDYLTTSDLQFGYKKKHSCTHAIFALKTCVDYFTERGSNVFSAFLDCSKGFDKINHEGMFVKLMQRNVPLCFINVLLYWYSNLSSCVKWNSALSRTFLVRSGVRQGGVLSPYLFAVYIDDLIQILRDLKIGCHIGGSFFAAIVYADDFCLLAPTRSALQSLLNACEEYGNYWCIKYNPTKSKVMLFGKFCSSIPLKMYSNELAFASECKYLGVTVIAGTSLSFSHLRPLIRFRCSANTILNASAVSSDIVQMKLLYSVCIPNLTYSCEVLDYTARQFHTMNVAVNDSMRRIFGFNRWESVRYLRGGFGYPSLTEIFHSRARRFRSRMHLLRNNSLNVLNSLMSH